MAEKIGQNSNNNRYWILRYLPFVVAVLAVIVGYVRLQELVGTQTTRIKELERRTTELGAWQDNWQQEGQLKEDVRQNAEIKVLRLDLDRIRNWLGFGVLSGMVLSILGYILKIRGK